MDVHTLLPVATEAPRDPLHAIITEEEWRTKPGAANVNKKSPTHVGIGMSISVKGGKAKVVDLAPGSSAWASMQISLGDVLQLVDGKSVHGKTAAEIVRMVKGEEGSMVVVAFQKGGEKEPTWVTLQRRHTAGIGITFERKEESLLVESIHPDGAAAKSEKLKVRDRIIAVDGQVVEGKSIREVVANICGPGGTSVSLTIQRDGHLLPEVVLQRTTTTFPAPHVASSRSSSSDDSDSSSSSSHTSEAASPDSLPVRARHWKRPTASGDSETLTLGGIYGGIDARSVPRRGSFRSQKVAQYEGNVGMTDNNVFPERNSSPSSSGRTSFSGSSVSLVPRPPAEPPKKTDDVPKLW